jgi:hypothetical protein
MKISYITPSLHVDNDRNIEECIYFLNTVISGLCLPLENILSFSFEEGNIKLFYSNIANIYKPYTLKFMTFPDVSTMSKNIEKYDLIKSDSRILYIGRFFISDTYVVYAELDEETKNDTTSSVTVDYLSPLTDTQEQTKTDIDTPVISEPEMTEFKDTNNDKPVITAITEENTDTFTKPVVKKTNKFARK